jgi:Ni,Fe-hydrogenase III small subunit
MNLKLKALTKSLWVFHLCIGGSCNNCDIEILDLLTPRFDVERFGIMLVGSVRHADVLLITGSLTYKAAERAKRLHQQMPKPGVVVAIGSCALGRGMFKDSYNSPCPLDELIPVDLYIPGCPPKPEAMIDGIVKLVKKVRGEK